MDAPDMITGFLGAFAILAAAAGLVSLMMGGPASKARNMQNCYLLTESMEHRNDSTCLYCGVETVPGPTVCRAVTHWASCEKAPEIVRYAAGQALSRAEAARAELKG